MDLLRVAVGLLSIFFAHFLGRSLVRVYEGKQPRWRAVSWALRTAVTLLALYWGQGPDLIALVITALAALSLGAGVFLQLRPRRYEELEKVMFPDE